MRLITLLAFALFFSLSTPSWAQDDLPVYKIADVMVEVGSGSAAMARDSAIIQAQRAAFATLMERLGAKLTAEDKPTDDLIASLVQAIDVQKEHAAGMRYTGTFTIQFKPEATRGYLAKRNVAFTETQALPVLVLPILRNGTRDTLWEETTPWHQAWATEARNAGLVPILMPAGDIEDASKITAAEALGGKLESLQALMQKYGADGVIVPVLAANLETPDPKTTSQINVLRFDARGNTLDPLQTTLQAIPSTKVMPDILTNAVKQIMGQVERSWRQSNKAPSGPAVFLPVDVAVPSLALWNQIRNKIKHTPNVADARIITMTRGLVHAEIEFRGDIPSLQSSLASQGLALRQVETGGWELSKNEETPQ